MSRTRLALGALVTVLGVAAVGSFSSSSGQSTPAPGITYGGAKGPDGNHAWLRLDSSRRLIAAVDMPYSAPSARCSNRRRFVSYLSEGLEWDTPMLVALDGSFSRRFRFSYRNEGRRFEERLTLKGTITDDRAEVSLEGTVKISGGRKPTANCRLGPQRWTLLN
jgi:hypothetical protein